MEKRNLICIGCPMGCPLTVELSGGEVRSVTGNTCKRGAVYGAKEVTNPTRIVTTTVRVLGGTGPVVPVKTAADVPKQKVQECVRLLKSLTVQAPVQLHQVILDNVAGTGVNVVAAKKMETKVK